MRHIASNNNDPLEDAAEDKAAVPETNRPETKAKDGDCDGRIVTIIKSGGGCGSSVLAVNLAGEFSRQSGEPVALIDLDIQFGNLALYLDIRPRHTMLEALQASSRLDETLLKSLMETHESGVELLAAPRHMIPLDQVDEAFVDRLLALLKKTYPVSVIELPSGWSHWFGAVFEGTDRAVLIGEPTVRGAAGLNRIMQSLVDLAFEDVPLSVIANKARKHGESNARVDQLKHTMRRPVEAVAYDAKAVDTAVNAGMLLSQTSPRSKAYKDITKIATRLLEIIEVPGLAEPRYAKGLLSGLQRRSE